MIYVVAALVMVIVLLLFLQFYERRDVYNRLMSRDVAEYRQLTDAKRKKKITKHRTAIDNWRNKV